jgi:hypothetical protein
MKNISHFALISLLENRYINSVTRNLLPITFNFQLKTHNSFQRSISVLKGAAGNPSLLNRFTSGLFDHE